MGRCTRTHQIDPHSQARPHGRTEIVVSFEMALLTECARHRHRCTASSSSRLLDIVMCVLCSDCVFVRTRNLSALNDVRLVPEDGRLASSDIATTVTVRCRPLRQVVDWRGKRTTTTRRSERLAAYAAHRTRYDRRPSDGQSDRPPANGELAACGVGSLCRPVSWPATHRRERTRLAQHADG